jgi:hypothetical protein
VIAYIRFLGLGVGVRFRDFERDLERDRDFDLDRGLDRDLERDFERDLVWGLLISISVCSY